MGVRASVRMVVRARVREDEDTAGFSTSKAHKSGSGFTPGPFDKGKPGRSNTWVVERAGGSV